MAFSVHSVINRQSDVWKMLHGWPKIELHRHLEGSLRLPTLIDVARQYDIPLPAYDIDHLRPYVQVTDADESTATAFLSKFAVLRQFYRSLDIIHRITREAIEDAATDNVKYMELRFTPHALAKQNGHGYPDIIATVCEETARAASDFDISVRLIVSVNRHEGVAIAREVLDAALAVNGGLIVALDLAGPEVGHSAQPFLDVFRRAQEAGLHATVHAGEWDGPANVREAVEVLGATRIGHGVRAVEDSSVIQLLRERAVTLEVCPTSNLQSGVVAHIDQHPLIDLTHLRVLTTINTDDPSISNLTLTDELALAHTGLGLSLEDIRRNILNGVNAAFAPEDERAELRQRFQTLLGMDGTRPLSPGRLTT